MITTLTGKNSFELFAAKKKLVGDFVAKYTDMALDQIDCESTEPQAVYDALTNLPFLVDKKLVVLNEPSKNKALAEKLPEWLVESESIDVLIIEPEPDKRTGFYKFLTKQTKLKVFDTLRPFELPRWIGEYAKENSVSISSEGIGLLIELAGADQKQLAKEIEKLALYKSKIEADDIKLLVEELPQNTVFDMLDQLVQGNQKRTMDLYESLLRRKVDPAEIIGMLSWQLYVLALIRSAGGKQADVVSRSGLHPFVVQKNFELASRLTLDQIRRLVDKVFQAELNIKKHGQNADNITSLLLASFLSEIF